MIAYRCNRQTTRQKQTAERYYHYESVKQFDGISQTNKKILYACAYLLMMFCRVRTQTTLNDPCAKKHANIHT